jgi:drug/metabolite transporter (DMT)-like permease
MGLDILTPIGYFFAFVGAILIVFGLFSSGEIYREHSLGINVNLWWGLVLAAFGGFMLAMAHLAGRKPKNRPDGS